MIITLPSWGAADEGPFKNQTEGREIEPHEWLSSDMVVSETIRIVTAYNAGDPAQNYGNPCISASGENLCKALSAGKKRCAANFVPLGTRLYVEKYGIFVVSDRTNRRYRNRVDIAMKLDEIHKAKQFGKQKLNVKILKNQETFPPKQPKHLAIVTQPEQ
jgi:3D (Asp-Asp-Asp) domain-containing protein